VAGPGTDVVARSGSGGAGVDPTVVARLVDDLGHEQVSEVCGLFLGDARELVRAIRAAHESGDAQTVARCAHRLKSASGFVGAVGVSSLCADIERLARDGRLVDLGPRVDHLVAELEHVSAELADLVA
jgi:HPt (histidine-containing phosphotransfer) domain-containing protein